MKSVAEVIHKDHFLNVLFDSAPCGILVMDREYRVQAINSVMERSFGVARTDIAGKCSGDILNCVIASAPNAKCGQAAGCEQCGLRAAAQETLNDHQVHRAKAHLRVLAKDETHDLVLLVSAAPLEFEGETLAVLILEDISELKELHSVLDLPQDFAGIVTKDAKMLGILRTVRELAQTNVAVLIEGESGTGKELVARAIHCEGPRAGNEFVPVNCGALPNGILESELFGHVKGAFTGAIGHRRGRFELAHRGTIFLDEVGDLSPAMQVKLLRVLETGRFERVGGEETIEVDARLISATNKSLREQIAAGRFRDDLFYRLCVVPVVLPPLRERTGDVSILSEHLLRRAAQEWGGRATSLTEEAMAVLEGYPWPGNVRELENALRFALVKCNGPLIKPEHLPPSVQAPENAPMQRPKEGRKRKLDANSVATALRQAKGNKAMAARLLGVGRATLYRFLSDCSLEDSDF